MTDIGESRMQGIGNMSPDVWGTGGPVDTAAHLSLRLQRVSSPVHCRREPFAI
jgi:hypothetical protein